MDIRHASRAAGFTGLVVAGMSLTGGQALAAPIEVDGVPVTMLESADYMPPEGDSFIVNGVTVAVLESADYMPPEHP